jgi:hypothetical protein
MAAAREYHGTIKSNQRWSGPDSVNSAGALGLLWNALMSTQARSRVSVIVCRPCDRKVIQDRNQWHSLLQVGTWT